MKGALVKRWERQGRRRVKTLRLFSADAPAQSGDPTAPLANRLTMPVSELTAMAGPARYGTLFWAAISAYGCAE